MHKTIVYLPPDHTGPAYYLSTVNPEDPSTVPFPTPAYATAGPELQPVPGGNTRMATSEDAVYVAMEPGKPWMLADLLTARAHGLPVPNAPRQFVMISVNGDEIPVSAWHRQGLAQTLTALGVALPDLFAAKLWNGFDLGGHPQGWKAREVKQEGSVA